LVLVWRLLFSKFQQNVEILGLTKISTVGFFLQFVQHDPTPNNMANRGNDDGRKNKGFNIDSQAFDSEDDDFDFEDDAFETFQKKKPGIRRLYDMTLHQIVDFLGKLKPKDLASKKAEIPSGIYAATKVPEPEPKPFFPVAPKLIPCIGCRQPFLRIKRPLMLNGPKFPYENECDYCGPCRLGIFAELKEQEPNSSQPSFYNPVVTTHIEAKSASSSTLMILSTSAAVTGLVDCVRSTPGDGGTAALRRGLSLASQVDISARLGA
jgi:hypothetical protein